MLLWSEWTIFYNCGNKTVYFGNNVNERQEFEVEMKKFTKIFICLMLCLFSVVMVACDGRTPEEKAFTYPSRSDVVSSNGGMAVRKGDYIYFVNGYMTISDTDHVQNGSLTHGSLMLMRLDEYGNVVTDEDGLLKDEYYITMSDRLCGYEATGLYIFGDYLYFTSPSQENTYDRDGNYEWAKDRVEFYRIKLDKTSGVERLFKSTVANTSLQYKYYDNGSDLYILINEKGTSLENDNKSDVLYRVKASNKAIDEVATGVSNLNMSDNGENVFYTKVENNVSKLYKYNVFTDGEVHFDTPTSETFKALKLVSEDYVYITDENDELYRRSLINPNGSWEELGDYVGHYDKMLIIPHSDEIMTIKGNKVSVINGESRQMIDSDASKINFIGFTNGGMVYYDDSNNIKIMDCETLEISTIITLGSKPTEMFDIAEDDTYMYFFMKQGANEYLYRVEVAFGESSEAEMLGVYIGDDAPVVEDSEEE